MNKFKKFFTSLAVITTIWSMSSTLTSCNDDDDFSDNWYFVQIGSVAGITYNTDGYWDKCYQTDPVATLKVGQVYFSHSASLSDWGGSWKGFCPSRSSDNDNYPSAERWEHQWASITGGSPQGVGNGYMLACWDVSEDTYSIPDDPSLKIWFDGGNAFEPLGVSITNTAYAYYTMKDGSDFSSPFDKTSYTLVKFIGVRNGRQTGEVTTYLAYKGQILDKWTNVDLSSLGEVDYIYCQMESSDSGQWGMNVPAYFCLDNLIMNVY